MGRAGRTKLEKGRRGRQRLGYDRGVFRFYLQRGGGVSSVSSDGECLAMFGLFVYPQFVYTAWAGQINVASLESSQASGRHIMVPPMGSHMSNEYVIQKQKTVALYK